IATRRRPAGAADVRTAGGDHHGVVDAADHRSAPRLAWGCGGDDRCRDARSTQRRDHESGCGCADDDQHRRGGHPDHESGRLVALSVGAEGMTDPSATVLTTVARCRVRMQLVAAARRAGITIPLSIVAVELSAATSAAAPGQLVTIAGG